MSGPADAKMSGGKTSYKDLEGNIVPEIAQIQKVFIHVNECALCPCCFGCIDSCLKCRTCECHPCFASCIGCQTCDCHPCCISYKEYCIKCKTCDCHPSCLSCKMCCTCECLPCCPACLDYYKKCFTCDCHPCCLKCKTCDCCPACCGTCCQIEACCACTCCETCGPECECRPVGCEMCPGPLKSKCGNWHISTLECPRKPVPCPAICFPFCTPCGTPAWCCGGKEETFDNGLQQFHSPGTGDQPASVTVGFGQVCFDGMLSSMGMSIDTLKSIKGQCGCLNPCCPTYFPIDSNNNNNDDKLDDVASVGADDA